MGVEDSIRKATENAMEDLAGTSKPVNDQQVPDAKENRPSGRRRAPGEPDAVTRPGGSNPDGGSHQL